MEHEQVRMKQGPYIVGITLNLIFVLAELVFSQLAHSTALFADAFHNLSDVLALVIAWLAVIVFGLKATRRHTYGWHNLSILASIFNSILLIGAVIIIFYEGVSDLINPPAVATSGATVMIVAAIGIGINFFTAMLFKASGAPDEHGHHHEQDLNSKTAYIHLLADAGVSVGVIAGGLLIQLTGWGSVDAIISMIIGVIILVTSWPVMASTFNLAINGVPDTVDETAILNYLTKHASVANLHDLHIWPLSTTETALTVHLAVTKPADSQLVLKDITTTLRRDYNVNHVTIQIESDPVAKPCNLI